MKQCNTYLILLLCLLPITVLANTVQIEYGTNNITWNNITYINTSQNNAYQINLRSGTRYYFRVKNETNTWQYFNTRTKDDVEESMSGLAITIFVLVSTIGLYILPFFIHVFSENPILNLIIKRLLWIIATYLMMLNSAILATIASNAEIPVTSELFRYMWLFGKIGYILIIIIIFKTFMDSLKMWQINKYNQRMGADEDDSAQD